MESAAKEWIALPAPSAISRWRIRSCRSMVFASNLPVRGKLVVTARRRATPAGGLNRDRETSRRQGERDSFPAQEAFARKPASFNLIVFFASASSSSYLQHRMQS